LCEADLETEEAREYLELLELSEIVPQSILSSMENKMECLDVIQGSKMMADADQLISL
jgi:hypothetical protein